VIRYIETKLHPGLEVPLGDLGVAKSRKVVTCDLITLCPSVITLRSSV